MVYCVQHGSATSYNDPHSVVQALPCFLRLFRENTAGSLLFLLLSAGLSITCAVVPWIILIFNYVLSVSWVVRIEIMDTNLRHYGNTPAI
jgi:hypothetical protein